MTYHTAKKKRRRSYPNPQRGNPGILVSCDTGRESRCARELLDLLQHDWHANYSQNTDKLPSTPLSLDDELEKLRNNANNTKKEEEVFQIYDTGCTGTAFVMNTACQWLAQPWRLRNEPSNNSNSIVAQDGSSESPTKSDESKVQSTNSNEEEDEEEEENGVESSPKRAKVELPLTCDREKGNKNQQGDSTSTTTTVAKTERPIWDPLQVATRIVTDIATRQNNYPGSRYIAKFIPVQSTVWASPDEIQYSVQQLLTNVANNKATFAIRTKRRACGHLTTLQIIDAVAQQVGITAPNWKVDLTKPEYTIQVEVCKSFVGISILPPHLTKLNLAELRDKESSDKDN